MLKKSRAESPELQAARAEVLAARAAVGVAARLKNREAEQEARRRLHAAKLLVHVRESVEAAPPLSPETLDGIASVLRGAAA